MIGGVSNIRRQRNEMQDLVEKYTGYLKTGNSLMIDEAVKFFDGTFLIALVEDPTLQHHLHDWREAFKTSMARKNVPSEEQKRAMLKRLVLHAPSQKMAIDWVCNYLQSHPQESRAVMKLFQSLPDIYTDTRVLALIPFVPDPLVPLKEFVT